MPQAKGVRTLFRRPTLLTAGVGTVNKGDPKERLGIPDPTQWGVLFDDFINQTGAGTAINNGWAAEINTVGTGHFTQISDTAATGVLASHGAITFINSGGATD